VDSARLPRKLAAILYADVAGYSRLTGEDEDATHRRLSEYLDVFSEIIERHRGRVMHYAGDAVLAMFEAVVDALSCAAFVQRELASRNQELPDGQRVLFRIGVNLGDVIEDRGDIYGDGVNIAARLESLAEPGGICISESVHTAVAEKLPLEYEFLGEQSVKNITKPVSVYRARLQTGADLPPPPEAPATGKLQRQRPTLAIAAVSLLLIGMLAATGLGYWKPWAITEDPASSPLTALPRPELPSIAVLAFTNMSGDPEQEYFSDGIAEDIITDLSQLSSLAVVARQSSFSYKGVSAKAQDIGKDLGVRYLLEGSVRKAGNRVRITAQLIDTSNGHHLWAERYDRELGDIFALQDDIKRRIVDALAVHLTTEEDKKLARANTNSFEAFDAFLQGRRNFSRQTIEGFEQAIVSYRRAINLDPNFARAYGALATTHMRLELIGDDDSPAEIRERALILARKAVSIDPSSAQAQWALGFVNLQLGQFTEARAATQRSVALSPSYADAYLLMALISNNQGRGKEALQWTKEGMKLNPHHTWDYPYNLGRAYYILGEYEKSVKALEDAVERNEENYIPRIWLAASYVRLGRQDDAEWEVMQIDTLVPGFSLSNLHRFPGMRDRLFDDLRTAGMPD
jgi:adenylate cyclase